MRLPKYPCNGSPAKPVCFVILTSRGRRVKGGRWATGRYEQAGSLWGDITAIGEERRLPGAAWRASREGTGTAASGGTACQPDSRKKFVEENLQFRLDFPGEMVIIYMLALRTCEC